MDKIKNSREIIIAPAIVLGVLFYVFYKTQLFPFGTNALNWGDMAQQNLPVLMQLRDVLLFKEGYSFSMLNAGGMDFTGIFLFLASSPFSLFSVFIPRENLIFYINIMIVLKLMTASVTSAIYFKKFFKSLSVFQVVALSVSYALCGYSMLFYQLHTWLDVMYMFPLLLIAFYKLIYEDKLLPYTITLSLMILFQFYLGYMLALFLILSFGAYILFIAEKNNKKKNVVFFTFGSFLAVLISAPVLLTAIKQFANSARGTDIIKNLVSGNFFTTFTTTIPFLLCSLLIFIVFIFAFKLRILKNNRSFVLLILYILMLVPVIFEPINKMWHTGSYQAFPVRYGFITVLIGLSLAAVILCRLNKINQLKFHKSNKPAIIVCGVLIFEFYAFVRWMIDNNSDVLKSYSTTLWGSESSLFLILLYALLALIILYIIFIFYFTQSLSKKVFSIILCLFVIGEGIFNASIYFGFGARSTSNFTNAMLLADKINDDATYRVKVKDKYFDVNLIGAMGYNSLAHYTSLIDSDYIFAMKKLGYSSYWMEVNSNGSTAFTDALLGNKYTIKNTGYAADFDSVVYNAGGYYICKNDNNMSLGNIITEQQAEALKDIPEYDRIGYQQKLYSVLTGSDNSLITRYSATCSEGVLLSEIGNEIFYNLIDDATGIIEYNIDVKGPQNLYFDCFRDITTNLSEPVYNSFKISVNGYVKSSTYPSKFNNGMLDLGCFENETVKIRVDVLKSGYANSLGVFGVDLNELSSGIKQITPADVKIDKDTVIATATAEDDNQMLMLTIPNSSDFIIKVNGRKVQAMQILDTFMAIPLEKGENSVELFYCSFGIRYGFIFTLLGIVLLAIFRIYLNKKHLYKNRFITENILYTVFLIALALIVIVIYIAPVILYIVNNVFLR